MKLSPIVLFVYNRPRHTEQTLNALMENDLVDQSVLYIYSDGPRHGADEEQLGKINEVRNLIRSRKWCKEVHIVESEYNEGLADSIVRGVTDIVTRHGRVIVLEDDLLTSRGFLKYMNEALELYKDDERVMHVSGYMYPADIKSDRSTFFLNILSCWGWGTWKRAWDKYNHNVDEHIGYFGRNPTLKKKFDIEGNAYFFKQLEKNAAGEIYSWAVRWYASWLKEGGTSLFPTRPLVKNIGHDSTGVHCSNNSVFDVAPVEYLNITRVPVEENILVRREVDHFFKESFNKGKSGTVGLKSAIKSILVMLGVKKVRYILKKALIKVYPELQRLENAGIFTRHIRSSSYNSDIESNAKVVAPYHLHGSTVGEYTYISPGSWISKADIGKFCSIGPNIMCGGGIHPLEGISTSPMFYSTLKQNGITLSKNDKVQERKRIKIGNDVFMGMNVTVLDGVTIGDGAVIGAGAVVSKDIPPYAIALGNPIEVIRYRFDSETISELLGIKWWDFPMENLKDVEAFFFEIEQFIQKYSGKAEDDNAV